MLTDTSACIRETEKIMKKTATIVKMTRPVKNGMYTDKYTVTYESGVTRTFKIVGGMIKVHLDFMMSADVEVIRTASGKHTCDVFTPSVGVDIRYKNCLITGSDKIRYVCVDWSGHYSPKSYATIDEAKAAIDEMIEAVEAAEKTDTFEQPETNEPAATPETNAFEVLSICSAIIATAEKFKNAYFFSSPKNATGRRLYEKLYSIPETTFEYDGNTYTVEYNVTCTCNNVYAKGYYTRNGEKVTLRTIKKIAAEISAAGVTII